jgi:hypothetical protein
MTSDKAKPFRHPSLGAILQRALVLKQQCLPETEDEVAAFEKVLSVSPVVLPTRLQDPYDFLVPRAPPRSPGVRTNAPARELEEDLARAAREGGETTPEVEARMKQDRLRAESEANDSEKPK